MTAPTRKDIGARMGDLVADNVRDGAKVEQHGELGPILVRATDEFMTAKEADRRKPDGPDDQQALERQRKPVQ
jgi:hypothetical protein